MRFTKQFRISNRLLHYDALPFLQGTLNACRSARRLGTLVSYLVNYLYIRTNLHLSTFFAAIPIYDSIQCTRYQHKKSNYVVVYYLHGSQSLYIIWSVSYSRYP